MNKYIIYVEIFVTVNCGARRNDGHHSEPKSFSFFLWGKPNSMKLCYFKSFTVNKTTPNLVFGVLLELA